MSSPAPHRGRDATTLGLLGGFFALFGALVLLGLLWPQTGVERVVTLASGLVLLALGGGGLAGRAILRRREGSPGE